MIIGKQTVEIVLSNNSVGENETGPVVSALYRVKLRKIIYRLWISHGSIYISQNYSRLGINK